MLHCGSICLIVRIMSNTSYCKGILDNLFILFYNNFPRGIVLYFYLKRKKNMHLNGWQVLKSLFVQIFKILHIICLKFFHECTSRDITERCFKIISVISICTWQFQQASCSFPCCSWIFCLNFPHRLWVKTWLILECLPPQLWKHNI